MDVKEKIPSVSDFETPNDNTPSDSNVKTSTNLIIKYLQENGPRSRIYATLPNEAVVYEIFLESQRLFAKNGSISFELSVKPIRKWHADLVLTKGSKSALKSFEEEREVRKRASDTNQTMNDILETFLPWNERGLPKNIVTKAKQPDLLETPVMKTILEELKKTFQQYKGLKGRLIVINETDYKIKHIVLFENFRKATHLINELLHLINMTHEKNPSINNKGGSVEKLAYKLGDMLGCSKEFSKALMTTSSNAKIFLKFFSSRKIDLDLPPHSATIFIVDDKRK